MSVCTVCGNKYDKTFEVKIMGETLIFDCFECAIHKLAPKCASCGCTVIGHGVESKSNIYCCAHCARKESIDIHDRV